MNNEHVCPECGSPIVAGEQFCADCGASLPKFSNKSVSTDTDDSIIGAGASVNVMEGIHKTSNTHINTSKVDNSSTVNNNTTIVMSGEKAEYCEVCGNPLGEKHAKCPKCSKHICFDCKVKGKNRCVECEKKCINEYRVAFQQLLLTTGGNIGIAGRQMMDQKARELDIEDVKGKVETELRASLALDKTASKTQVNKSAQPEDTKSRFEILKENVNVKKVGIGSAALALLGFAAKIVPPLFMPDGGKYEFSLSLPETEHKQEIVEQKPTDDRKESTYVMQNAATPEKKAQPATKPVQSQPAQTKAAAQVEVSSSVVKKIDANYENGMAAYKSGNGLEAVKAFTKSASAEAYYMLGMIYKNGCGTVGKNEMMARKHFKKAVSKGHKGAESEL